MLSDKFWGRASTCRLDLKYYTLTIKLIKLTAIHVNQIPDKIAE